MLSSFRAVMLRGSILVAVVYIHVVSGPGALRADERFPNELNSSIDEPQIILKEDTQSLPSRTVSTGSSETEDSLVKLVIETREAQRRRLLSTNVHTPWQIMHGLLGLRQDFIISHDNKTVNGLEWIASGPKFRNEYWFEKTKFGGRAHPYSIPYAFEGHVNQFLAILSMSGLPLDYEFATSNGTVSMRDMLSNAQKTVNDREEITWTLWALSRYLPPDAQWRNASGEPWSIEKLVKIQTDKPLQGAPCGGTHGLFALAHARNVYLRKGKPLRGVWIEAEQKIRRYIQTARMQQNSDGTLSSNFFRGREYKQDFDKRMASAGHILEFLMIALPQEELSQPWVRRAIEATCNDLMKNRHEYVSCSPLYHTVNALSTYLERVAPAATPGMMANAKESTKVIAKSRVVDVSQEVKNTTASTDSAKAVAQDSASPATAAEPAAESVTAAEVVKTEPVRTESVTAAAQSAAAAQSNEPTAPSATAGNSQPTDEPALNTAPALNGIPSENAKQVQMPSVSIDTNDLKATTAAIEPNPDQLIVIPPSNSGTAKVTDPQSSSDSEDATEAASAPTDTPPKTQTTAPTESSVQNPPPAPILARPVALQKTIELNQANEPEAITDFNTQPRPPLRISLNGEDTPANAPATELSDWFRVRIVSHINVLAGKDRTVEAAKTQPNSKETDAPPQSTATGWKATPASRR